MAVRAEIPPALDAIVRWCLAVDPAARPSATELSAALARFRTDPTGAATYAAAAAAAAAAASPVPLPGTLPPTTQTGYGAGRGRGVDGERSGSGPWTWMAAGLGLLVIIASGILLFLLFSGIGEESPSPSPSPSPTTRLVSTPDFVGRMEESAVALADRRGVVLEIDYLETAEHAPGRVIAQLPAPETEVPAGTIVQVTVATRIETVVVPDVHGIREEKAIAQLEASGVRAGDRFTTADQLPAGYVVHTEPRAGASVTRGSEVAFTVSTGPATEPTSRPVRTAAPRPTPTPPARPSPTPTPFPSSELVLVGDFQCQSFGDTRAHLLDAGLLVGATYPDELPDDSWLVYDQLPEPGSRVPLGTAVDLMLGDPQDSCPPT